MPMEADAPLGVVDVSEPVGFRAPVVSVPVLPVLPEVPELPVVPDGGTVLVRKRCEYL